MIEMSFSIVLFCLGMAGVILRKNIIMALLCLFISNLAGIMFLRSAINTTMHGAEGLTFYLLMFAATPLCLVGTVLIMSYFELSKTIMNEEMKSWLE